MTVAETAQGKVASVEQPAAAGCALTAAAAIAWPVETQKALKTQATSGAGRLTTFTGLTA